MDSVVDGPMDLFDLEDAKVVVEEVQAVGAAVAVEGMDNCYRRCRACKATTHKERKCMGSLDFLVVHFLVVHFHFHYLEL